MERKKKYIYINVDKTMILQNAQKLHADIGAVLQLGK